MQKAGQSHIIMGDGLDSDRDRVYVRTETEKLVTTDLSVAIASITYYCPSTLLKHGLILEDTPGTNDTDALRRDRTFQAGFHLDLLSNARTHT